VWQQVTDKNTLFIIRADKYKKGRWQKISCLPAAICLSPAAFSRLPIAFFYYLLFLILTTLPGTIA
jgi:hypothetical protein